MPTISIVRFRPGMTYLRLLVLVSLLLGLSGMLAAHVAARPLSRTASDAQALPSSLSAVEQLYLKATDSGAGDNFGFSIAISGDTLVVGAPYEDSAATGVNGDQEDNSALDAGAVYVYVRSGEGWIQQAYLKASNAEAGDLFGYSVAISGDTLVVGARSEDSAATGVDGEQDNNDFRESGAAYVFVRSQGAWYQQAYLKASNTRDATQFGHAVTIDGNTLVVGSPNEFSAATGVDGDQTNSDAPFSGAAYVFVRSQGKWSQQAYLKASNTENGASLGSSLDLSGDTLVVGAPYEDSAATGVDGDQKDNSAPDAGSAYVFVRSEGKWSQQAYIKASNTDPSDYFGYTVSVSGDTLVVGAPYEDSAATGIGGDQSDNSADYAGAAYVFVRSEGVWSQEVYLKASNNEDYDSFGLVVDLSGERLLVGGPYEESGATGVDGDQSNNDVMEAGAVYLFERSEGTWSQQAYLKALSTDMRDSFGYSVALSGNTIVAGMPSEDSAATGIGGDYNDNSAENAGAVYIFQEATLRVYLPYVSR